MEKMEIFNRVCESSNVFEGFKIFFNFTLLSTFRHSKRSLIYLIFLKLSLRFIERILCCPERHSVNQ